MATLERAIEIAAREFAGITDKGGAPYIWHCLRVGMAGKTVEEQITGVLHDIKEDRGWTTAQILAEGFTAKIDEAIDSVTRRSGETYMDFVRRSHTDPIGRNVKRNDLNDNSRIDRIPNPTEKDFARVKKYERALLLLDALDVGEAESEESGLDAPRP